MRTRKLCEVFDQLKVGDKVKLSKDNFMSWWEVEGEEIYASMKQRYIKFKNLDFDYSTDYSKIDDQYIQYRDESSEDIEDVAEGDLIMSKTKAMAQVITVYGDLMSYRFEGSVCSTWDTISTRKDKGWKRVPTKAKDLVKVGEQWFRKEDLEKLTPVK